jgi:integrase
VAEGIQERHRDGCPTAERPPGRCRCRRSYRGAIYDPRTKKRSYSGWHADKAAAVKWRAQAQRELSAQRAAGISAPGETQTISDAWADWIAGAETGSISTRSGGRYKSSTLEGYQGSWSKHLEDEFGSRRLASVTRFDLQKWSNEQAAGGMVRSTLNNALDPLRVLYRRALRTGEVASNPVTHLDLPSKASEPIRFATRAEAAALIDVLPADERALWGTAFYAGLRRSELRALRCRDLDFTAGVLVVTRAWTQAEGSPKSHAGVRRVPVCKSLAGLLKAHLELTERTGDDLVFGRTASLPFVASTIRARALKAWAAVDPPLDPIGLHSCRHTCASFLIESGANAKALSAVMGHASIEITFNLYGHLMPGAEAEVGRQLDAYLAG